MIQNPLRNSGLNNNHIPRRYEHNTVRLKPGGDEIDVTRENVTELIRLWLNFRFGGEIKEQLSAFIESLPSLIRMKEISKFRPELLGMLISGVSKIDIDDP
jgi:hypothetical protein